EVRAGAARGNGRGRRALRAAPGLPLRFAASPREAETPGCPCGYFLAYPLAEPGGLWHLPMATRVAGRAAGCGLGGISHSVALQQLSTDCRPHPRVTSELGTIFG